MRKAIVLTVLVLSFLVGCEKDPELAEYAGVLQKQGTTTYQYGTHVLNANGKTYALTSKTINLDYYVNRTVTVTGERIPGYPLNGGPDYLEVQSVR